MLAIQLELRLALRGHTELSGHQRWRREKSGAQVLRDGARGGACLWKAAVLKNDMPETPVILFTYTELRADSLYAGIGVDFISKVYGIPKLLERVDALFPPTPPKEPETLC